jgi:serine/threonine protein kinase
MSALFAKIKEGKYFMPDFISGDVKDLINRMLQPNPVKRIAMREIKEHPWYLKDLPRYLQDLSSSMMNAKPPEIDREIVRKLFSVSY